MVISPVYLTGFDRAPGPHPQTSVNASVSAHNTHAGAPPTIAQEKDARDAKQAEARASVARAAAPTTSYNAQGKINSAVAAQTGGHFHAAA
ncbi:MAG TPA: hypothetical protein VIM58_08265 [Candidatus Methylacidiphilales bacterium]